MDEIMRFIQGCGAETVLLDAARSVYAQVSRDLSPEYGYGNRSFGASVSEVLPDRVAGLAASRAQLTLVRNGNTPYLRAGPYQIYFVKYGPAQYYDVESFVWSEMSQVRQMIARRNSEEQELVLFDRTLQPVPEAGETTPGSVPHRPESQLAHLFFAHTGERVDAEGHASGEFAAYLGAPRDNDDGGRAWYWLIPLYPQRVAGGASAARISSPSLSYSRHV